MNTKCKFVFFYCFLLLIFSGVALADECMKREEHTRVTFLLIDKTDKNANVDQLTQSFDALQPEFGLS